MPTTILTKNHYHGFPMPLMRLIHVDFEWYPMILLIQIDFQPFSIDMGGIRFDGPIRWLAGIAELKKCIRWWWFEKRSKFNMLWNQGLRNHASNPKHFFAFSHLEERIFWRPAFSWIFEISEIWSPAGELWTDLRPAGKRPGRISMDFQQPRQ